MSVMTAVARAGSLPSVGTGARPAWMRRLRRKLAILDVFAGLVGAIGVVLVRYDGAAAQLSGVDYRALAVAAAAAWPLVLLFSGCYERRVIGLGTEEFRRVGNASVRLLALLVLLGFVTKADVSRSVVLSATVAMASLTIMLRWMARKVLHAQRRRGRCLHRVVVVGTPGDARALLSSLDRSPYAGLSVIAACLTEPLSTVPDTDVPVLGSPADAAAVVERVGADTVAVASAGSADTGDVRRLAWSLEGRDVDLLVAPALTDVAGPRLAVRPVDSVPLLEVQEPVFDGPRKAVKGAFDRVLAALSLAVLALPLVAIGLLVRLTSPGPALFRQIRIGRDGEQFTIWKFRTMVDGADRMCVDGNDVDGLLFKIRRDPRITGVGAFLRRWSLDELPQLFNVLRGDMSLVGPRPPLPSEVAQYGDDVRRRLLVKPGLTGLWQVSGRSDLPWEECVRLDLRYVENWSVSQDLVILARTAVAVLRGRGAY